MDVGSEGLLPVNSDSKTNLIILAQIGAPHGIKGEVRVKPFGDPEMLDQYGKLETQDGRTFKIKRMRPQKNMLVVKFEGVNTREEAEALNRVELFIDRAKLPEPEEDEFYVSDLIGMKVMINGGTAGLVKDVPNFGAGDMIEIEPQSGGASYYLPFTEEVVPEIDFENGALVVVPPAEVSERDEQNPHPEPVEGRGAGDQPIFRQAQDEVDQEARHAGGMEGNTKQQARHAEGMEGNTKQEARQTKGLEGKQK